MLGDQRIQSNDLGVPPGRTGRAAVEIIGDVSNFGAQVERDLNAELRGVDVDVKGVARQISEGIDEGTKSAGRSFDGLNAKAKASLGELGDEADRAGRSIGAGVRKGTDQARDEMGRFIATGKSSSRSFSLSFSGLGKVLGGIGKAAGMALGLGVKGAAAASAANAAAGLIVALAPAVGAVGALAPAFIASKVAAGAFQIAMLGVADAVSAGITGDTEAFNEALKQMPPTAQAAMKEIVGLKDQITAVRTVVQGNFFGPLVGQIQPLGATYLPLVANQLGLISQGFGQAAASTASFLRLPSSVQSVNDSLGFTRQAVNNVTSGVPGLVRAFLPLWEVGSSFLPGLTGGFDQVTQKLGAFMERAAASGQLHEFISNGLSALGELGQVLGSVGSILGSVFQAASAAGGGMLGVIGEALGQFAAFLNTAQGMSALTSIFQVLGQVAGIFGQALAVVLPIVGNLVSVLAGALQPVLPVISSLIQQMAPVIAQVGQALGAILGPAIGVVVSLLSTLIPVIMPIVQALMGALMPVITALAPVITTLGQVIGTILGAALQALMPIFTALLPVIQQLLQAVLTPLVPILQLVGQLFMALMPAIQPLIALAVQLLTYALKPLTATIPIVAQVLQWLIQALTAITGPIASAIGWVANFLAKLLESQSVKDNVLKAWNAIKSATSAVFGFVKTYVTGNWNAIKAVTSAVWGFIKTYISNQINIVKAVLRGIGTAITAVVGFFNNMKSRASSAVSSMRSAVSGAVTAVIGFFGRLASGAAGKISNLIATVRGIGGRIRSAVGNLASLLVNAGRNVIQGLINGITSKLGALRDKAASAAATIRNLFPFSPAKEGPLSGRGSPDRAGAKIANMVAAGLRKRTPAIRAAAERAAEQVRVTDPDYNRPTAPRHRGWKILQKAHGHSSPAPTIKPRGTLPVRTPPRPVHVGPGAFNINFYGAVTPEQGYAAGLQAGRGLEAALQERDVRTTVRSM